MNHSTPTLSRTVRCCLSIFVIVHVAAVFAEPFRFFSQSPVKPASAEAGWLRQTLAPYVDFMYLSHGYAFFAPNPGPSHLLECEIKQRPSIREAGPENAKNSTVSTLRDLPLIDQPAESFSRLAMRWRVFPDRAFDRPRLLYHRYFMLSEFYHTLFAPVALSEAELNEPGLKERWQVDRAVYESLQSSITNRLQKSHQAESIKLRRIEHELPSELQVLGDGWKLNDPRLYLILPEGEKAP
jgi:hypothetical protein